ncbi:hypothetical protein E2320_007064, partial [Naja naja]
VIIPETSLKISLLDCFAQILSQETDHLTTPVHDYKGTNKARTFKPQILCINLATRKTRKPWPYCPVAEMVLPNKGLQQYCSQKIAQTKLRPPSVNWNVLAGRTQCIAPVGAWVESAQDDGEESPVFATAIQIEKEYKEQQKEKEKTLKHFQQEVKRRVNQRVNLKRKQQLKTSYEAALKESSVIIGFSDSALRLTPKKNTCLYRYTRDSAIGNSNDKVTYVQQADYMPEQFSELAKTVRKTVQQVRHKLASRKAVPGGNEPPEHPGGAHQTPPRRQVNSDTVKDNNPADTEAQVVHIFWPGIEKEQSKKQHQSQYLRYRRLFMDIEREQVKEQQRQKEWQRKMDKIRKEKECQRRAEEQQIQEQQRAKEKRTQEVTSHKNANPRGKTCEKLQQLKLEDPEEKKKLVQKNKEYSRCERRSTCIIYICLRCAFVGQVSGTLIPIAVLTTVCSTKTTKRMLKLCKMSSHLAIFWTGAQTQDFPSIHLLLYMLVLKIPNRIGEIGASFPTLSVKIGDYEHINSEFSPRLD